MSSSNQIFEFRRCEAPASCFAEGAEDFMDAEAYG